MDHQHPRLARLLRGAAPLCALLLDAGLARAGSIQFACEHKELVLVVDHFDRASGGEYGPVPSDVYLREAQGKIERLLRKQRVGPLLLLHFPRHVVVYAGFRTEEAKKSAAFYDLSGELLGTAACPRD